VNTLEALETTRRLKAMGILVRSPSLQEEAKRLKAEADRVAEFYRTGNRSMRRAAARGRRRRGR
jgi:hypothetical protein